MQGDYRSNHCYRKNDDSIDSSNRDLIQNTGLFKEGKTSEKSVRAKLQGSGQITV